VRESFNRPERPGHHVLILYRMILLRINHVKKHGDRQPVLR
jgi:hypothetical protein